MYAWLKRCHSRWFNATTFLIVTDNIPYLLFLQLLWMKVIGRRGVEFLLYCNRCDPVNSTEGGITPILNQVVNEKASEQ
jgi:hypothetical protein